MKFIVETSARHVHVTQEDLEVLFGKGYELTKKKDLSQPGQFASNEKVTIVGPKKEMTASILGPVRSASQVEISLHVLLESQLRFVSLVISLEAVPVNWLDLVVRLS